MYNSIIDRQHVVDILPNVWMLDGRLITGWKTYCISNESILVHPIFHFLAKERKQVEDFFNESQSSLHPVVSTYFLPYYSLYVSHFE